MISIHRFRPLDQLVDHLKERYSSYIGGDKRSILILLHVTYKTATNSLTLEYKSFDEIVETIEHHYSSMEIQEFVQESISRFKEIDPKDLSYLFNSLREHQNIFSEWFNFTVENIFQHEATTTPTAISTLILKLLKAEDAESIVDPCCGTGGLINATLEYIQSIDSATNCATKKITAIEENMTYRAWALLRSMTNKNTIDVNFFDSPSSIEGNQRYDAILTNPPFGRKVTFVDESFPKTSLISPKTANSETATIMQVTQMMNNSSRAAVIIPNGFLFRGGYDSAVRQWLVEHNFLRAVISLPEKVFAPYTTISTSILFLESPQDQKLSEQILFIDTGKFFKPSGRRNVLSDGAVEQISALLDADTPSKEVAFASPNEIKNNGFSLEAQHYFRAETTDLTTEHFIDRRQRISLLEENSKHDIKYYEELREQIWQHLMINE